MKLLFILGLVASIKAYPSQRFGDGGFQPIPAPAGVFPRGRALPLNNNHRDLTPSGSELSHSLHAPSDVYTDDFNSNDDFHQGGVGGGFHHGGGDDFHGDDLGHGASNQFSQSHHGGGGTGPVKTIYVNVPSDPHHHRQVEPKVAGPPRKHYRIVFIKSPAPPPPPQPILPPRVEQKTLIYVLHPKAEQQQQEIVEVPDVQHDPEVYFIRYDDKPPTPEELQGLVKDSLGEYGPQDIDLGSNDGYGHGGSNLQVAGSGILTAKTQQKGFGGQRRRPHQGRGNNNPRYSRNSEKKVQFDGPFARSRYQTQKSQEQRNDSINFESKKESNQ